MTTQSTLANALDVLSSANLVIKNKEIGIDNLESSDASLDEKLVALCSQGRAIGVYFYKGPNFSKDLFMEKVDKLSLLTSTGLILLANMHNTPPNELTKFEEF